ncbi:MAG: DUF2750 domain-containing protein [Janthinobacterium lividum]
MLTLEITALEQHKRFINRVIEAGQVWALQADEQWIFSDSNEDEEIAVFTVWSDRAYAQRCAISAWQFHKPASIPLAEFLESWCAGLHNNQELVGTNWDQELRGLETEPLALVLEILIVLEATGKTLALKNHDSTRAFAASVRQHIS